MQDNHEPDIARRTVSGSLQSISASVVTLSLGFLRATLMARLLLPEHFGVTTLALFYVNLAAQLRSLGVDNALVHRKETDQKTMGTYFALRLAMVVTSLVLLALLIPILNLFYPDIPLLVPVLLAYMATAVVGGLNSVQMTVLSKELAFRQMAVTDVFSSVTMTLVGPLLAWSGFGVWSIVAERLSGQLMRMILIWGYYRPWRPHLGWDGPTARWFWRYGIRLWLSSNLGFLLDRFDDWWIGSFLGSNPLGFYSRAYEFAGYPRRVISNPLVTVFFPTFARLQDDRQRLSRAFFRLASLIVRGAGLFSLVFIITAPEFIRLLLGEKWIPMVTVFQLMIVYTLLDPLTVAATNLLAATGFPDIIARARVIQTITFIPAVVLLGGLLGINGVAVAADVMVLIGTIFVFRGTKRVVDYSQRALWLWPLLAVLPTLAVVLALGRLWMRLPLWGALVGKSAVIVVFYLGILWLAERRHLLSAWRILVQLLQGLRSRTK